MRSHPDRRCTQRRLCPADELQGSYRTTGDCFDNAAIESLWGALRRELRHIHGDLEQLSRSQMRTILIDHIEVFYNRQRHHKGLDRCTPAEVYAAAIAWHLTTSCVHHGGATSEFALRWTTTHQPKVAKQLDHQTGPPHNHRRCHTALDMKSPTRHEQIHHAAHAA